MALDKLTEKLTSRLAGPLDHSTASSLAGDLLRTISDAQSRSALMALFEELGDLSPKALQCAIEVLPELKRRSVLLDMVPWLDLGVALAESSGAAAMKYFKESPLLLSLIEPGHPRQTVLRVALELAEGEANIALDFLRNAPELLGVIPAADLARWAEVSADLVRMDYVLGIEFFRGGPSIARVIPLELLRDWVALGAKLITPNTLGKPDYLGTLEFFRASPSLLGDVADVGVRKEIIALSSALADRDPAAAVSFLAEAPVLLRRMPSDEWSIHALQYGMFVATRDAETTLVYLRRCPEIVTWLGDSVGGRSRFEEWFKGGMEVLAYSIDGARAYFALETKQALASIEQAMNGVSLRHMARSLKLFAQGMCGTEVLIESLPEGSVESAAEPARARVGPDGRTITLPALVRRYPTRDENARLYMVMTAHEAGHLEFGTYEISLADLRDLIAEVNLRYGRDSVRPVETLGDLFERYPQSGLIRDLWTVLEDARVEYRLQREYPGLQRDLAALAREAVNTRSFHHGLTAREMVVDCLLLLSTAEPGTVNIPGGIAEIVERVWALSRTIFTPAASATDTVKLADRLYVVMDEMIGTTGHGHALEGEQSAQESGVGPGPKASENISGIYRSVTNWVYRGDMNPDLIRDRTMASDEGVQDAASIKPIDQSRLFSGQNFSPDDLSHMPDGRHERATGERLVSGVKPSSIEDMLIVRDEPHDRREAARGAISAFFYDEWDSAMRDYRSRWCRVVEQRAAEGDTDFADAIMPQHGPAIRLLRRHFENLRAPGLRRVSRQADGEEVDLDAAIKRTVDRLAGTESSERVYVRRDKKERDVAVAFLVDLSGSTGRQMESGRRVIDVEKEGLVMLAEAVDAIGDQYAIYGYSAQGRQQIDFVIVKDFDEPRARVSSRLGSVNPLHQNRDGAAIRHAGRKLLARDARVRLLVLVSDGRPLDDAYADEYALEDTKKALQEARMSGVEPFCITVDREADDYLRRMYGDVRFVILDRVEALPERLPKIYQRLTT